MRWSGVTGEMIRAPQLAIWVYPDKYTFREAAIMGEPMPLPLELSSLITRFVWKMNPAPLMHTFEMTLSNARLDVLDAKWLQKGAMLEVQWGYLGNLTPRLLCVVKSPLPRGGKDGVTVDVWGNCIGHVMAARARHCVWTRVNVGELKSSPGAHYSDVARAAYGATVWGGILSAASAADPQLGYAASEIAIALAEAYGFEADVQYAGPIKPWNQCGESDWDFLMRLASEAVWIRDSKDLGFRFWVDGKTLHFHAVTAKDDDVVMRLAWYVDDTGVLKEFEVEDGVRPGQDSATESTVCGWDPRRARPRGAIACNSTFGEKVALGDRTGLEPGASGTGKNRALADFLEVPIEAVQGSHDETDKGSADPMERSVLSGETRITAETGSENGAVGDPAMKEAASENVAAGSAEIALRLTTIGMPQLWQHKLVDVPCLGSKLSGYYEIEAGVHNVRGGPNGYECVLQTKRNAKGPDGAATDAPVNKGAEVVESKGEAIKYVPFDFGDVPAEAAALAGGGARSGA